MTIEPMIPIVHLNGTSYRALVDQLDTAIGAVEHAIKACQEAAPHGRDYYVRSSDAIHTATLQHLDRLQRLNDVQKELIAVAQGVVAQKKQHSP